ncbi:DUF58 domain-containing protein [Pontibacillus salipaludis]|uniref:DUF58 domain-containing protein n=1 Tax=Pontibacillus salipaludis TaxID=1697394 RepID=A0ABQ1QGT4_9BACI|nr:DUF58 domain-containing protein [Pontibacillus salipaludis]GGD27247.1 hypothetical protein GCM10011389_38470 [Pontibacillus salipaludis]
MQWRKELGSSLTQSYDKVLAFSLILLFTSLVFNRSAAFIMIGAVVAFVSFSLIYDRLIGKGLTFQNEKHAYKMFPGDRIEVPLSFENQSRLPIINGRFQFKVGSEVQGEKYVVSQGDEWTRYEVPLTVVERGKTEWYVPFEARRRGVTILRDIHYSFPHLLNFHEIFLYYLPFHRLEFIVYPEPLPVYGIEERNHMTLGSQQARLSPFEDPVSPMGTRDYTSSDPFHRIHWKASARKQTLQTKVLEKNWDHTWSIVINLTDPSPGGHLNVASNIEALLSYAAYMCQLATKKGYPFELYINARKIGTPPFYYLPEGNGKEHLQKALEFIARIKARELVISFSVVLHRFDQQLYKPKTVFLLGSQSEEVRRYAHKWSRQKFRVYAVQDQGDFATLQDPLEKEGVYGQS